MNLLSIGENIMACKSYFDPVFVEDERVLTNLLKTQESYAITCSYFKYNQPDLSVDMREEVAQWMLEICEEEKCQEDVFPLAMNIMDRFLSIVHIRKTQLQLLGTACLFLSSKLRQTRPLCAYKLIVYTDNSITMDQLSRWELLVLSQLKWDLAAVTPNDFLRIILRRLLPVGKAQDKTIMMISKHSQIFIDLCATDFRFSLSPPSAIAAACVATALFGLTAVRSNRQLQHQILAKLSKLTCSKLIDLLEIHKSIESLVREQVKTIKAGKRKK